MTLKVIPYPIFGESRFLGNSQIPDPVNIFIVFPIPAPYFGQIPSPENTLPDPQAKYHQITRKNSAFWQINTS